MAVCEQHYVFAARLELILPEITPAGRATCAHVATPPDGEWIFMNYDTRGGADLILCEKKKHLHMDIVVS